MSNVEKDKPEDLVNNNTAYDEDDMEYDYKTAPRWHSSFLLGLQVPNMNYDLPMTWIFSTS